MNVKISPSILSADFANLGADCRTVQQGGAEMLHIDVMDGHFVPNISIGVPVVASLNKLDLDIIFDVHLMISEPHRYIEPFESDSNADETIELIKAKGIIPAISVKPKTPAEAVFPYLDKVGMVLVMTVEPGFGGQSFMADMMPKVAAIRAECDRRGIDMDIQVDGGIDLNTAPVAAKAGANVLVAGSSVFGSSDPMAMVSKLKKACE